MNEAQSAYTLAIKTVADLKALADTDRALKLSTDQTHRLAEAMEALRQRTDAASRGAADTAQRMLERQRWLASLPEPKVTLEPPRSNRATTSEPTTVSNEGGALATTGEARANAERQRKRDEERRAGLETERQMREEDEAEAIVRKAAREQHREQERRKQRDAQAAAFQAQQEQEKQGRFRNLDQKINERGAAETARKQEQVNQERARAQAELNRRQQARNEFVNSANTTRAGDNFNRFTGPPPKEEKKDAGDGLIAKLGAVKAAVWAQVAAISGVFYAGAKAVRAYADAQQSASALDASLNQRGQNVGAYAQELHKLAFELSKGTAIPKDAWIDVLAKLTQFGATKENIGEMAKGVENLAGIMGGDLNRASLAFSKAMQGNFESLREMGIRVPENSTHIQKMDSVMRQAAELGAGQLRARAETLAGSLDIAKNAAQNLMVAFGGFISRTGIVQDACKALEFAFETMAEKAGGIVPELGRVNNVATISNARLNEVANKAAAAAKAFASMTAESERATNAMRRQESAMNALLQAQNKTLDAELQLKLAQIDDAEKRGRMTQQQAIVARARATAQSEQKKFANEQAAEAQKERAAQLRAAELGGKFGVLDAEKNSLESQYSKQQEAHRARGTAANAEAKVAQIEAEMKKMESAWGMWSSAATGENPADYMAKHEALKKQRDAAAIEADKAKATAKGFGPEFQDGHMVRIGKELGEVKSKLLDLTEVLRKEMPVLQDQISNSRLNRDTNAGNFGLQRQTDMTRTGTQMFEAGGGLAQLRLSPQQLAQQYVAQQRQVMMDFTVAIRDRDTITAQALVEVLQGLRISQADYNRLKGMVTQLQRQTANRPGG